MAGFFSLFYMLDIVRGRRTLVLFSPFFVMGATVQEDTPARCPHRRLSTQVQVFHSSDHHRDQSTMKLLLPLTALLVLASAKVKNWTPRDGITNYDRCMSNNLAFVKAIEGFCKRPGSKPIHVPSKYATGGAAYRIKKGFAVWARVEGRCKPKQWLPRKYCLEQFYEICAKTSDTKLHHVSLRGFGRMDYGWKKMKNGKSCQRFVIELLRKKGMQGADGLGVKFGKRAENGTAGVEEEEEGEEGELLYGDQLTQVLDSGEWERE